jgi:hypothetical protein
MSYCRLCDCWTGLKEYDLNGIKDKYVFEKYTPRVTMPYSEWVNYVGSGKNVILGSGGVIPSGTVNTPGGLSGAVYRGHVRQGY